MDFVTPSGPLSVLRGPTSREGSGQEVLVLESSREWLSADWPLGDVSIETCVGLRRCMTGSADVREVRFSLAIADDGFLYFSPADPRLRILVSRYVYERLRGTRVQPRPATFFVGLVGRDEFTQVTVVQAAPSRHWVGQRFFTRDGTASAANPALLALRAAIPWIRSQLGPEGLGTETEWSP